MFNLWYFGSPPWDTGISPPELMDFISRQPPGRALDLGCGTGTNVITLAQHGWQVTGVDFAPRAIRRAREKARRAGVTVRFLVDDVTRLKDVQPPFDLILDMGCYHGIGSQGQAAYRANLSRLLAPGGTFLLYVFFRPHAGAPRPGVVEADLEAIGEHLELVERADGAHGKRPAAWLRFQKA